MVLPHQNGSGRIPVPAVHDGAAVDGDDVPVGQYLITGDPVNDLIIDGHAHGGRIAVVAQEVGLGVIRRQHIPEGLVHICSGGPGNGSGHGGVERAGSHHPGSRHERKLGVGLQFYLAATKHGARFPS